MTWPTAVLATLVARVESTGPDHTKGEFNYIDLSAVDSVSKTVERPKAIQVDQAPGRARQRVVTGDVLISTVRPNLNSVAQVQDALDGSIASTGFSVLRPVPEALCARFLFHWVTAPDFVRQMTQRATGASYPAVSDAIVKASRIPLPTLREQRRIAAILDQADALRRTRRRTLGLLDELEDSLFADMFWSGTSQTQFEEVSVRDACTEIVDCVNRTAPLADSRTEFKMIRTTNVRNRKIDVSAVRYVNEETFLRWNVRLTPRRGDVVLTREAPAGEAGILETDDNIFLGQRLMLYRADTTKLLPEYLLFALMSPLMVERFNRVASGSTVKHLSVPFCREFRLPLPELDHQSAFAQRIVQIAAQRVAAESALAKVDALFLSLQHRAFIGGL